MIDLDKIKESLHGLNFISETDAPFELVEYREINFDKFFEPLIKSQDWHGQGEKEQTEKFSALKKLLKENYSKLVVAKIGKTDFEIYIVGIDEHNKPIVIRTRSVET